MSTHMLDFAEALCQRFVLLGQGFVRALGDSNALRLQSGQPEQASLATVVAQLVTNRASLGVDGAAAVDVRRAGQSQIVQRDELTLELGPSPSQPCAGYLRWRF